MNFIVRIIKSVFFSFKKREIIIVEKHSASEIQKISFAYNILVIGGMALLLLGMSYGGVYGAFFLDKFHAIQENHFKTALDYAATEKIKEAKTAYDQAAKTQMLMEAVSSGHAHLTIFGLIGLALAINVNKLQIKEKWKNIAAIALITGGLILPIGVVLQPLVNKTLGKVVSIIGGLSVMSSIAVYILGMIIPKFSHLELEDLKLRDTLTIGAIAGIIGTVVMHLLSMLWKWLGLIKISTLQVAATLFLSWDQVNTPIGYIVGAASHLMIGAAGGVILAYFIRFSGKDYYWLKGLALSGLMLLAGMGFVMRILKIAPQMGNDGLTTLLHIISYMIYGLVSAYIIAKYSNFIKVK